MLISPLGIGLLHYQDIRLKGRFSVPAEEYQLLQSKGDQRVIQRLFRDSRMAACGSSSSVVFGPFPAELPYGVKPNDSAKPFLFFIHLRPLPSPAAHEQWP
jgi:hypothetical protein